MNRTPRGVPVAVACFVVIGVLTMAGRAQSHCQVPCGIYDDAGRIAVLREDATTVGKAITQMGELAGKNDPKSLNQMTRWITTKEDHASHIITVVSEYFLTQKVKPVAAGAEGYEQYLGHLAAHHAVMVAAMKSKQEPTADAVAALNAAIDELAKHYQ